MNLKKLYLLLITLVFSLSVFSQPPYNISITFKNYTTDGKYEVYGHIINTVTLATDNYQFTVPIGPSNGVVHNIPVLNEFWVLKDLRVAHDTYNLPYANFSNYPLAMVAGDHSYVYRPSTGNNKVIYKADTGYPDGNHEYNFVIKP